MSGSNNGTPDELVHDLATWMEIQHPSYAPPPTAQAVPAQRTSTLPPHPVLIALESCRRPPGRRSSYPPVNPIPVQVRPSRRPPPPAPKPRARKLDTRILSLLLGSATVLVVSVIASYAYYI